MEKTLCHCPLLSLSFQEVVSCAQSTRLVCSSPVDPPVLKERYLDYKCMPLYLSEMCMHDPPDIAYATFKALSYKNGTILNCECKRGFRRTKELVYMVCLEDSWSRSCQCTSNSHSNSRKPVTPKPEDQKERPTTEMQKSTQSVHQVNLPASEESQGSRDPFPESETSCPITTTTDFQLLTEAATTMETFIFTMEYQIA
ncbi:hypothetical protein STEG23_012641, partial [Scotinomys teguina]